MATFKHVKHLKDKKLESLHNYSSKHKREIFESSVCQCFYCLQRFKPVDIKEWIREETAICPLCGVDSVLGSSDVGVLSKEDLDQMRSYWFEF